MPVGHAQLTQHPQQNIHNRSQLFPRVLAPEFPRNMFLKSWLMHFPCRPTFRLLRHPALRHSWSSYSPRILRLIPTDPTVPSTSAFLPMAIAVARLVHIALSMKHYSSSILPHDLALEYVHGLVHNSQTSASLQLLLDLAHAPHADYARPDLVYVLRHDHSGLQLDHDLLGIDGKCSLCDFGMKNNFMEILGS